jgi:hypothetical protein
MGANAQQYPRWSNCGSNIACSLYAHSGGCKSLNSATKANWKLCTFESQHQRNLNLVCVKSPSVSEMGSSSRWHTYKRRFPACLLVICAQAPSSISPRTLFLGHMTNALARNDAHFAFPSSSETASRGQRNSFHRGFKPALMGPIKGRLRRAMQRL